MQIAIEISEEHYKLICANKEDAIVAHDTCRRIANGIPLPKGHGDLIDRNDLLADSYCIDDWMENEVNIVDVMAVKMADTIIKADKVDNASTILEGSDNE